MLRLRAGSRKIRVRNLLFDLDRTLTDERLRAVPTALKAIDAARQEGIRAWLVTGRNRRQMITRDALLSRFDGFVFEAGGLAGTDPLRLHPTAPTTPIIPQLAEWLTEEGVDFEHGDTCLSLSASDASALDRYPGDPRSFIRHPNRDRIDVTAPGVDKGAGVRKLLGRTSGSIAFADGENDRSLFEVADYRVAVANAVPELKAIADETTQEYGGRGVARFLNVRLLEASVA